MGERAFQGAGAALSTGLAAKSNGKDGTAGTSSLMRLIDSMPAVTANPIQKKRPATLPPKPPARQISRGSCAHGNESRSWSIQRRRRMTFHDHIVAPSAASQSIQQQNGTIQAAISSGCQKL